MYPALLRTANVSGEVLAEVVVNKDGRADTTSLQVIRPTHPLFGAAVPQVLPELRFTPAEVLGRKVRQRVRMPFNFALERE